MLAQAGVTHHGIYIQRVCTVYDHVYNVPSYKGILYLECWPNVLFQCVCVCVCVCGVCAVYVCLCTYHDGNT